MTQPQEQPAHEAAFFATIRSWGLTRGDHGLVGGVIEGVGERIGLARVPARLIFVLIAIFTSGLAALAYAAGWGLLPDRRGNIIIQNFGRGVTNVGALLGIALLTLIGLGGFSDGLKTLAPWNWAGGWPWDDGWGLGNTIALIWWFIVVGGLTWLVIHLVQRSRAAGTSPVAPPAPGSPVPPAGSASAAPPVYAALPGEAGPGSPGWNAAAAQPQPQPQPQAAQTAAAGFAAQTAADAHATAQQQAWQAQQHAQQQAWEAQQRARAAAAARPPRIPGPGAAGYLSALAWLVLSGVGVWIAERNDLLSVHPLMAWPVAVLIGWGAILMVVSFLGRRLGFLGFLTVAGILPVLAIGSAADQLRETWADDHTLVPPIEDQDPDVYVRDLVEEWIQDNIDPEFSMEEAEGDGIAEADAGPEADAPLASPASFFSDYSSVVLRGSCYAADDASWGDPTETIALSTVTEDTSIDVTSEVVDLTIPEGTNVRLVADGEAWATAVWPDRGVWCDFADSDVTYVDLASDTEAPTLTLVVYDDDYANTILIHETPAAASTDSEVQE